MFKKLFTITAVAVLIGAGLTACSAPAEETLTAPAPAPVVVEEKETASVPSEEFIEFGETANPTYDGVPVACATDDTGSEATSARVTASASDNPTAIKGDTSYFTVDCVYPANEEIMNAIGELNASEE